MRSAVLCERTHPNLESETEIIGSASIVEQEGQDGPVGIHWPSIWPQRRVWTPQCADQALSL